MPREIRYRPNGWTLTKDNRSYPPKDVEQQEIWEQLDQDTWQHVTLCRPVGGFRPAPYIRQARMLRDQQPNGAWRYAQDIYASLIGALLVEDSSAPGTPAPIYQAPETPNAAARHMERTPYAIPGKQEVI